ncbi:hypothetical protein EDD37DRAFT_200320 [Exophiala viscosa]|uniref:uncharacterized protein n=1 Tax=Exophiala viscosa TaxID=2486360 RepID=UPI00218FF19E|nr:hypothetical protein EDD37DRAFT_200320 [Exophiala viscosa]
MAALIPQDHHSQPVSTPLIRPLSNNDTQNSRVTSEHQANSLFHEQRIARKPVPIAYQWTDGPPLRSDGTSQQAEEPPVSRNVHWVTPTTAVGLFLLAVGMAFGHHFFLKSLNDKPVSNQAWVNRYSLAMAFVVKFSVTATISLAYVQRLWFTLHRTEDADGVTIRAIDALFNAQESFLSLFVVDLWRSALLTALVAVVVWLMPLIALVSPTALSVGLLTQSFSMSKCAVPTLDMTDQNWQDYGTSLALSTVTYTGVTYTPSMTARRIVTATYQGGQQLGWTSPCGSNCTYSVNFVAPALRCTRTPDIDSPQAPWTMSQPSYADNASYWFSGYGSGYNYSFANEQTLYDRLYYAGLNENTNQLWVGVSNVFAQLLSENESVQQALDVHVYFCDFMNSSYTLRVTYRDGQQTNDILNVSHINSVGFSSSAWNGRGPTDAGPIGPNGVQQSLTPAALDTAAIYQILISTINGSIFRDPREVLVDQTTIALVPTLISQYNGSSPYGQAELAIPHLKIGPLIEELSHNISISLLSEPRLQITNITNTSCATTSSSTVWKYSPLPLIVAYSSGIGLALLCLAIGAHAMLSSGCARDKTFSSIVRTTRSSELNVISSYKDDGALPLSKKAETVRIRLLTEAGGRVAFRLCKPETDGP